MLDRRQFVAAAGLVPLLAQGDTALQATAAEFRRDAVLLHNIFTHLHPGAYRYLSHAGLTSAYQRLVNELSAGQSLSAAYLAITRYTASLRCGHTYPNFYNQTALIQTTLFSGKNRLPFLFRWIGSRMVVSRPTGELAPGTEILSINGKTSRHILQALLPLVRSDGHNDAMKLALLSVNGADDIETFDVLFALAFGEQVQFDIVARQAEGKMQRLQLNAIDLKQRQAQMPVRSQPSAVTPAWTFDILPSSFGRLTMTGWALYNSDWDWRLYLDQIFERLHSEKIAGLIIDLRNNEGGLDCGDEIIARLIDKPISDNLWERRVRYRQLPAEFGQYMDTWDDSFRDWGDRVNAGTNGFFRFKASDTVSITPKGKRYNGRVAVLIDGSNHSATLRFLMMMKQHKLGTLIGTPSGGNLRGINGGAFFFVRLPETGLEVDLPLIGYFSVSETADAGIKPDIPVNITAADIGQARDIALERAVAWLAR